MIIGYARVSTIEQNLESQEDALTKMNCIKIFTDKISGKSEERPGLSSALTFARAGDTLVVLSLSRLGRSLKQLIEISSELENRKIALISLTEQIDTNSPSGKLLFHLLASLAQFEADLIKQRTLIGLQAARERGRVGGRPTKMSESELGQMHSLARDPNLTIGQIAKIFGVSKATIYRKMNT